MLPWFLKVRVLLLLIQASRLVSFILINVCLQSLSSTQLFVQLFYFTRPSIPNQQLCWGGEAHTTSSSQAYYNWRLVPLAWLACPTVRTLAGWWFSSVSGAHSFRSQKDGDGGRVQAEMWRFLQSRSHTQLPHSCCYSNREAPGTTVVFSRNSNWSAQVDGGGDKTVSKKSRTRLWRRWNGKGLGADCDGGSV